MTNNSDASSKKSLFMTYEEFNDFAKKQKSFYDRVETILHNKLISESGSTYEGEIIGADSFDDHISVYCYDEGFHGDADCMRTYKFPISYLFDDSYIQKLIEQAKVRKEKEIDRKLKLEIESQQRREAEEAAEYQRLRQKFEGK